MAVVPARPIHLSRVTWNRLLAIGVGALFLLLGVVGFVVSFGQPPLDPEGMLVVGYFTVNPLQSVLTLATGAVLLVPGIRSLPAARRVNRIMGALLLASGIAGLYVIGTPANILALSPADVVLQFATSALLLGAGFGADRETTDEPGGPGAR